MKAVQKMQITNNNNVCLTTSRNYLQQCRYIFEHNDKIHHPKHIGSAIAKDELAQWDGIQNEIKERTLKRGKKIDVVVILSSIKTVARQCSFLQTTEGNFRNQQLLAIFLDDRIQENDKEEHGVIWWWVNRPTVKKSKLNYYLPVT